MSFKNGDKVRLLNERGEGTVVSLKGNTVYVRMEDGFELPFLAKQLVPVQEKTAVAITPKKNDTGKIAKPEETDEFEEELLQESSRELDKGVYLAYELLHPGHFSNTALMLQLVNHTEYELQYNLSLNANGLQRSLASDRLAAGNKVAVEKVAKTAIEAYCTITVQLLFGNPAKPFVLQPPFSGTIRVKATKLYKPSGFVKNRFTQNPAFFVPVIVTEPTELTFTHADAKSIEKAILGKEQKHKGLVSKKHFRNSLHSEKEVDLHIEELLDDLRGLSNGEIVQVQLKHFQRELDQAIANHLHKIIFIHGVGTGKLKAEIHRLLKGYDNVRFHDASYSKYGFGATEVIIR